MDDERTVAEDSDGVLGRIELTLQGIHRQLESGGERAAARERVIDRLHDENQQLRAGERHLVLRPVLVDLQRMRSELLRVAGDIPPAYNGEQARELLRSFAYSAELALERGGVTILQPQVGAAFDAALHRAAQVVEAEAAEADGTVAAVLGDGYFDVVQNRAISPAVVCVYRWTAPEPAAEPVPEPEPGPAIPAQAEQYSAPASHP